MGDATSLMDREARLKCRFSSFLWVTEKKAKYWDTGDLAESAGYGNTAVVIISIRDLEILPLNAQLR